jgi:hypothetical protein
METNWKSWTWLRDLMAFEAKLRQWATAMIQSRDEWKHRYGQMDDLRIAAEAKATAEHERAKDAIRVLKLQGESQGILHKANVQQRERAEAAEAEAARLRGELEKILSEYKQGPIPGHSESGPERGQDYWYSGDSEQGFKNRITGMLEAALAAKACDLQWGASALWKRDEQKERIEALERDLLACQERLRAAEEDARRDGMVWVPVEPTDKMIAAAMHCLDGVNLKTKGGTYGEQKYYKYIARYKAMLSAFPEKGKE